MRVAASRGRPATFQRIGEQQLKQYLKLTLIGFVAVAFALTARLAHAQDPLPSWNDGPAKKAIVAFVKAVTDKGGKSYVPQAHRIATFDQDGTLWVEQPAYAQAMFALNRVGVLAPQHPEW
jgi:hypothetical protein